MRMPESLPEWEEYVVVTMVQSLWGLVSAQLRGVAVEVTRKEITVFFAVTDGDDEELNEDLDDIIGELVGLLMPETPDVTKCVHVGSAQAGWEGPDHRLVLLAKASGDEQGDLHRREDVSQ